jgi:hypothetical protein
VTEICEDIEMPNSIGQNTNFTSLTFNKEDLFGSVRKNLIGDTLVHVDPCDCTATEIGQYGFSSVNGITSNVNEDMLGVAGSADDIIEIDPNDASSVFFSNLPGQWGNHGLTWSDPNLNVLYAIEANSDILYTFDADDGTEQDSVGLNMNFGSVGIEYHPGVDVLYTCSNPGDLWSVDINNGMVTVEAQIGLQNCDNLAAPFGPVACIPQ